MRERRLSALMPGPPAGEQVEGEEKSDGDRKQEHRDRRRSGQVVRLDATKDVDGSRLCLEWDVPRQQDKRSELADSAGEGQSNPCDDRRPQVGEDDAAEDPVIRGTE